MSDRDERRARRANEQQPAIPDGGLNAAMPAWLTERPRWAEAPTKDAPPPVKQLPPPDTSRIELSSILDVTDLPAWLQDVARRVERREARRASSPIDEPVVAVAPEQEAARAVEAEPREYLEASQPEPQKDLEARQLEVEEEIEFRQSEVSPEIAVEDPEPAEPFVAAEDLDEREPEPPEPVSDVATQVDRAEPHASLDDEAARDAAEDAGNEVSALDTARLRPEISDEEQDSTAGDPFALRGPVKGQPVDWVAVRREANAASDSEPAPASNPLLAKNPPARIDPLAQTQRSRGSRSRSSQDRPWWMSDPAIAVLLVAFILTMIYVILVASEVL